MRATVRKMSSRDADEVACSVVRLFAGMVREATLEAAPALVLNGALTAAAVRTRVLKPVLQAISLYAAAEA